MLTYISNTDHYKEVLSRVQSVKHMLWNGEDMEVLEPYWLRKEIAGKIKRMWNKYKDDSK